MRRQSRPQSHPGHVSHKKNAATEAAKKNEKTQNLKTTGTPGLTENHRQRIQTERRAKKDETTGQVKGHVRDLGPKTRKAMRGQKRGKNRRQTGPEFREDQKGTQDWAVSAKNKVTIKLVREQNPLVQSVQKATKANGETRGCWHFGKKHLAINGLPAHACLGGGLDVNDLNKTGKR